MVKQLATLLRQILDDYAPAIPRSELWATAGVTQTAANLVLSGRSPNRVAIARIAEVLCRSNTRARVFIASNKTRREIRAALERALPVLEQGAPHNVRGGLAEVRHRLHLLGQAHE